MSSRWWPAAVVAGTVLALSLVPLDGGGAVSSISGGTVAGIGVDMLLHLVDYAAVTLALLYATRARSLRACLVAFLAAVVFGGAIELLQVPAATRHGSLADAAANSVGAGISTACWWLVRIRRPRDRLV